MYIYIYIRIIKLSSGLQGFWRATELSSHLGPRAQTAQAKLSPRPKWPRPQSPQPRIYIHIYIYIYI